MVPDGADCASYDIGPEEADEEIPCEELAAVNRVAETVTVEDDARPNIFVLALVIGVLVVEAVCGWFTLPIAVLIHEISEFVVIGSGLRMLRA